MPEPVAPKVSMQTKLSYGYGSFGKDFSLVLVNTFLFFYLTDVAGMSAAVVGVIFLVARIWDTINDPLFGYYIAKSNSRWGKYKPWILSGNILQAIFLTACFATHYFEGTAQIVYLTVVYICWGMSYTICDAPFWSLIPMITLDKGEREGLLPYPRFAATIGGYLASGCGVYAVALFGQGDDGYGYLIFGAIGGILAVSSAAVACKWTEQNYEPGGGDEFNLKEAVFIVTHNKQFLIFLSLAFCYIMGTGIQGALNLYVFKYVLNDSTLFSTMMLWAGIITIPALIFFKMVVGIVGRKLIFSIAISAPFIAAIAIALASYNILPVYPMVIISGLFTGLSNSMYWLIVMIMVADTVDFGDYRFNIRSECIYYSLHTLLSKCSGAVSAAVVGIFLAWINYVPNVEQSQSTIDWLVYIYTGSTILCLFGLAIYLTLYHLNGETLDKVQRALTRRYVDQVVDKAVEEGPIPPEAKEQAQAKA